MKYVLSGSAHIAGVINPPDKKWVATPADRVWHICSSCSTDCRWD